jgi:hypothetical protein
MRTKYDPDFLLHSFSRDEEFFDWLFWPHKRRENAGDGMSSNSVTQNIPPVIDAINFLKKWVNKKMFKRRLLNITLIV